MHSAVVTTTHLVDATHAIQLPHREKILFRADDNCAGIDKQDAYTG